MSDVWALWSARKRYKTLQPIYQFHVTSLGAFKPLIQVRLSHRRHHLPYAILLHHTFIPHKLFHRTGWNRGNSNKDLRGDELLKGLGNILRVKMSAHEKSTRVAHRHQHLLATAHHANTATPNFDWRRL